MATKERGITEDELDAVEMWLLDERDTAERKWHAMEELHRSMARRLSPEVYSEHAYLLESMKKSRNILHDTYLRLCDTYDSWNVLSLHEHHQG